MFIFITFVFMHSCVREVSIDLAHRLMNHEKKCFNIHGHTYKILVEITGELNPKTGMIMDFSELDRLIKSAIEEFDHSLVLNINDPLYQFFRNHLEELCDLLGRPLNILDFPGEPTAELMSEFFYNRIDEQIAPYGISLYEITVYETPKSFARYSGI